MILDPKREFYEEETMGLITNNYNRAVICYFLSDMILVTERSTETSRKLYIWIFFLKCDRLQASELYLFKR